MKKLISFALTLILAFSLSITVFASNTSATDSTITSGETGPNPSTSNTELTFKVAPTYTVTIPMKVELKETEDGNGNYTGTGTVSAQNVRLESGQSIKVTMKTDYTLSTQTTGNRDETGKEDDLPYTVSIGNETYSKNNGTVNVDVATFGTQSKEGTPENVSLAFKADTPKYAGTYSDTVEFTIGIDKPNTP